MDECGNALEIMVVLVVAPGAVERFTSFKWESGDRRLVESGGVGTGKVFLEHFKIFAVKRRVVMVAANQRRRLKFMDQRIGALELPVGVRFVPHAVKPDASDVAIVRQQFCELRIHEFEIVVEVAALGAPCGFAGLPTRIIVRTVPVELRVIKEELNSLLAALLR